MANAIYTLYKQSLLAADANVSLNNDTTTDGVYVALVNTTSADGAGNYYPVNTTTDQYYSIIPSGSILGTDQRVTAPAVTNGVLSGGNLMFPMVASAFTADALVVYRKNSGASSTWRLVAFIDTGVTGLPATPNGGNIMISWNASGILAL